jgi:hypothetical protein
MIDVQLFIRKNTLVLKGTVTTANTSPYTTIEDSSQTYTTNQFEGHFIKITSGTGVGSISYIISNTDKVLTLETGILVEVGTTFNIYRADYQKLDLFKSEKISITSQISSANDIGKVFTDFTQSFTIPASVNNNQILSHWYESSIDEGFDHRVRYAGYIEINSHRFKDGNFQLEKASKKNGFIETYTLTFYGNLTQLKDIIQDDKLKVLDFTEYNHNWDYLNVINRVTSATTTGDIKYPLIGSTRKFYYNDSTHHSQDITTNAGAINWNELFPAIKISNIFLKIKEKYGINFTGSFLNLDQYTKLYLYLKPSTELSFDSEPVRVDYNQITNFGGQFPTLNLATNVLTITSVYSTSSSAVKRNNIFMSITPFSGFTTIPYTIRIFKNNILYKTFSNLVGGQEVELDNFLTSDYYGTTQTYYAEVSATASFEFYGTINNLVTYNNGSSFQYSANRTTNQVLTAILNIGNYMPDITIANFLTGIIKAFNLMIIPTANNVFELTPLESYYNAGKITDITKYVYANEMEIEKPKLFKALNFTYEKSSNIINNFFRGYYLNEYGDLIYNPVSSNESASFDIKLPFENVLFERTAGSLFQTATIIDKDLKPYIPKPMLIYCNGLNTTALTGNDRIVFHTPAGGADAHYEVGYYNRFSNEYNSLPTDLSNSGLMTMNFGSEQSSWYSVLAPKGLYYRHYKNYVDNLYNIKTRIIKVKALLPPSLMTSRVLRGTKTSGIYLNDRLIIRNKRYIINSFTTDLTTGEANFELITDYRGANAVSSIGYRFATYSDLEFTNEATEFKTMIYLNDYDSFEIKGATNFLVYTRPSTPEYNDFLLSVTVPENKSGSDRTDEIGIEFTKDGVLEVTEKIIIKQLV